jgi:nitrogen fixation protein NifQ
MMETAAQIYEDLIGGPHPQGDEFDVHVAASVIAISMAEASTSNQSLVQTLGLDAQAMAQLADAFFPNSKTRLMDAIGNTCVSWGPDEGCLRDLLVRYSTKATGYQRVLADILTRRAQSSNHLWQDLGLQDRSELTQLMVRHFAPLKDRNVHDMKWKKFLYRTICRDEGYGFCAAPTCGECDDYHVCFGDETGQSLMALAQSHSINHVSRA